MKRFWRMLHWAIDAYRTGRRKDHGIPYTRRTAFILAAAGFHIGMGWIGWWTDPMTWIVWIGDRRIHKEG